MTVLEIPFGNPTGGDSEADPLEISNICQLQNIGATADNLTKHYKLIENIDASAHSQLEQRRRL